MHAMHMRAVEHTIRRGLCTQHDAWVNHTENRCRSGTIGYPRNGSTERPRRSRPLRRRELLRTPSTRSSHNAPSKPLGEYWARGLLEPATVLEDQVERGRNKPHQHQRERVAQGPVQLRHVIEVHPVDGTDERRCEQDRRPGADLLYLVVLPNTRLREGLDLLVLLQPDESEVDTQDVLEEVLEARDPLCDLYGVVLDVPEIALQLRVHLV